MSAAGRLAVDVGEGGCSRCAAQRRSFVSEGSTVSINVSLCVPSKDSNDLRRLGIMFSKSPNQSISSNQKLFLKPIRVWFYESRNSTM